MRESSQRFLSHRALAAAFLVATMCCPGTAQISAPRVGYVRLNDGTVRVVRGVAGAFSIGETVLDGVDAVYFNGKQGWAKTASAVVTFDDSGSTTGETDEIPTLDDLARIEGDELVIVGNGVRLRLPFAVERMERAAAEYVVLSGSDGKLVVHLKAGHEAVYSLPEPGE